MFTLYNVVSNDGFIARPDGSEDFIPDGTWPAFLELCSHFDALIMGRATFDTIRAYPPELLDPFEGTNIRKVVISRNEQFSPTEGYTVLHSIEEARRAYPDALVTSGPTLNDALLREGMVGTIRHLVIPEDIGSGIRPYTAPVPDEVIFEKVTL